MFIKIYDTNYFIIIDDKSVYDIFNEIYTRMNKEFISTKEKRKIIAEIKQQIKNV